MPLPPHIVSLITTAWDDGYPLLVAVNGPGGPVMGPKGSMIVFDGEHLAYLERTRGTILDCLKRDPRVRIMYVNMKAQRDGKMDSGFLRFFGTAQLYDSGPMREAIFAKLHKREQEHVGADQGIGVLIRIDSATDTRGKPLRKLSSPHPGPRFARPEYRLRRGPSPDPHRRKCWIPAFAGMTPNVGQRRAPYSLTSPACCCG